MEPLRLTRTHRILVGVVVTGAVFIAGIGFVGSYAAVRALAERKGFGWFAVVFPVGIDAGIVVLLALDLLLTWIRIPFPLLRQAAWLLTLATVAFNGAAAWPDPLGVGMHAVIPLLFIAAVEAARHAVGRIADITADRHMESVRLARWLLAFPSTFRLWRRMKLWELRSYEEVIALERDRMVYRARLRARYGRAWRRRAPIEAVIPLKLARYGVPITDTAPADLAPAEGRGSVVRALPSTAATANGHRRLKHWPVPRPRRLPGPEDGGAPRGRRPSPAAPAPVRRPDPRPAPVAVPAPPPPDPGGLRGDPQPTLGGPTSALATGAIATRVARVARRAPAGGAGRTTAPAEATDADRMETYYSAFADFTTAQQRFPDLEELSEHLFRNYQISGRQGGSLRPSTLRRYFAELRRRYAEEHDLPA